MPVPRINKKTAQPIRSATARWGNRDDLFYGGFLVVPTKFFTTYASLRPRALTSAEALFVLHLMCFKWEADDPYPSYATLAKRMGVTPKMARLYAKSLQEKGYLMRKFQKGAPNRFDLNKLFSALSDKSSGDGDRSSLRIEKEEIQEDEPSRH